MAEYVITGIRSCFPLGEGVSLEDGASSIINPMTALGLIDRTKELKAKACIITAAASQLGRMLIRLCVQENITPICTVRRAE